MVIEKVFGICATTVSLSDRFRALGPMRRPTMAGARRGRGALTNRQLIALSLTEQRLLHRIKMLRGLTRGGMGRGGLRRSGSEGSLFAAPSLRRSNSATSFGPSQFSRNGSYSNLSRAGSIGNLSQHTGGGSVRGRGRGAGRWQYVPRGRFTNGGVFPPTFYRGVTRWGMINGVRRVGMRRNVAGGGARGRGAMRGARGRGAMRGTRGRGAMRGVRGQARGATGQTRGAGQRLQQKPVPTKEELDVQLDKYMSCSKPALDRELDEYMKDATETSVE